MLQEVNVGKTLLLKDLSVLLPQLYVIIPHHSIVRHRISLPIRNSLWLTVANGTSLCDTPILWWWLGMGFQLFKPYESCRIVCLLGNIEKTLGCLHAYRAGELAVCVHSLHFYHIHKYQMQPANIIKSLNFLNEKFSLSVTKFFVLHKSWISSLYTFILHSALDSSQWAFPVHSLL